MKIVLRFAFIMLTCGIMVFNAHFSAWGESHQLVITDELQLGLAESFMSEGEYYRAITEYKKFLYFFPDSSRCNYVMLQIGMAYYQGKEFKQAVEAFAKVRQLDNEDYFTTAAFYEGVCQQHLNDPAAATDDFERVLAYDAQAPEAEDALAGISITALGRQDWQKSLNALQSIADEYPYGKHAPLAQETLPILEEAENHPRKSPLLAGILSAIVPGSGYVYAERYRDGLSAFLINGLFIAGTAVAIDHGNYPVAALLGGAGFPFYLGNIYGSASAAEKWNLSIVHEMKHELSLRLNFHY